MELLLGIDGGGTGTRAALATPEGCIQFLGTAGPSNPNYAGFEAAVQNLRSALEQALGAARSTGIQDVHIRSAFAGIAGAGNDAVRSRLHTTLAQWPELASSALTVDHDLLTACVGAHGGQPGIVVIAGTGSAAFGINASGETARAGGWGARVDDVGSASWLAVEGLKAVVRAHDGRLSQTALSAPLLSALGVSDIHTLGALLAQPEMTRDRLAALAPLVIAAAMQGDPAARAIVSDGARELSLLAAAIAAKLFREAPFRVAIVGGTSQSDFYIRAIRRDLAATAPRASLEPALSEAVQGAVLLAKRVR